MDKAEADSPTADRSAEARKAADLEPYTVDETGSSMTADRAARTVAEAALDRAAAQPRMGLPEPDIADTVSRAMIADLAGLPYIPPFVIKDSLIRDTMSKYTSHVNKPHGAYPSITSYGIQLIFNRLILYLSTLFLALLYCQPYRQVGILQEQSSRDWCEHSQAHYFVQTANNRAYTGHFFTTI